MKLFDPARPQAYAGPAFIVPRGVKIPCFYVAPLPDGRLDVEAHLPVEPYRYAGFNRELSHAEFAEMMHEFAEDPEATLARWFGWIAPTAERKPLRRSDLASKPKLTLEDLDL